jgi:hypothetical protein
MQVEFPVDDDDPVPPMVLNTDLTMHAVWVTVLLLVGASLLG